MIYVVIDSCVFVKAWTQSVIDCEVEHLASLGELVDNGTIRTRPTSVRTD